MIRSDQICSFISLQKCNFHNSIELHPWVVVVVVVGGVLGLITAGGGGGLGWRWPPCRAGKWGKFMSIPVSLLLVVEAAAGGGEGVTENGDVVFI